MYLLVKLFCIRSIEMEQSNQQRLPGSTAACAVCFLELFSKIRGSNQESVLFDVHLAGRAHLQLYLILPLTRLRLSVKLHTYICDLYLLTPLFAQLSPCWL